MSDSICFNKNIFLTMVFIVIVATALYMFNNQDKGNNIYNACKPCKPCPKPQTITKEIIKEIVKKSDDEKENDEAIEVKDPIREMDYRRLDDPLSAPYRRLPRYAYPNSRLRRTINYPTRGYPDNFHYVGNLIRKSDEKFIKLFGRQTYPGSNKYEYYGITTDPNGMETKIPIKSPKEDELMDKDEIDVEIFTGGKFQLYLNEYDVPRYNPYLFN